MVLYKVISYNSWYVRLQLGKYRLSLCSLGSQSQFDNEFSLKLLKYKAFTQFIGNKAGLTIWLSDKKSVKKSHSKHSKELSVKYHAAAAACNWLVFAEF